MFFLATRIFIQGMHHLPEDNKEEKLKRVLFLLGKYTVYTAISALLPIFIFKRLQIWEKQDEKDLEMQEKLLEKKDD